MENTSKELFYPEDQEEIEKPNLLESLMRMETFTQEEIIQAQKFREYLKTSNQENCLFSFINKALNNIRAEELKKRYEAETEEDYQDRRRSLIYV